MKKKFLLITLIMCILGGVNLETLNAQETVTIGDGQKDSQYVPFNANADGSISQTYYLKSEIGEANKGKTITAISYKQKSGKSPFSHEIEIYMVNTESTNAGSVTMAKLNSSDLMYSGEVEFRIDEWVSITLDTPFSYTGDNILVCVNDKYIESFASPAPKFYCYSTDAYKTLYKSNTSYATYDPTTSAISAGNSVNTPCVQFTFSGTSTPTPPTVTLNTPENGANGIFNPSLNFTLGSAEQYQIQMAEGTGAFVIDQDWTDGNGNISYQTNLLKSNTTYSWKVVARCSDGGTGYLETTSEVYTFTTKEFAAPGELTNVSPENNAQDLINPKLEWTFGENTEEQQLLINGEVKVDWTNIGTKISDSYQTSGLTAGSHTWQVNTRNGEGTTTGTEYSFTVVSLPDNVTPISPADGAIDISSNVIRWQFADNTTKYRFLFSTGDPTEDGFDQTFQYWNGTQYNGDWLMTNDAEEMEIELPNFSTGTTYYWAVDVQNSIGQRTVFDGGDPISIFSFTTSSVFPATLEAPANNATIENPTVTLQWQYVGDATKYQVCYGTDADNLTDLGWKDRSEIEGGTGGYAAEDEVTIEGLSPATTYYWKVQVRKDGGNVVDSELHSFTTIGVPEAVTNMQPSNGDTSLDADPNLSWAFGENTKEYQLLFGTTNPPTDTVVGWTSTLATSYQTSGLKANVTYYWQVNVKNGFRETKGTVYSFKKPGIPENVEPIDPTDGATGVSTNATLTWTFAPNTTHYRVLMDLGSGFEYVAGEADSWLEVIDENGSFSTTTLRESDKLKAGTTYKWAIEVRNNAGERVMYENGNKTGDVTEFSFTTSDIQPVSYTNPTNNTVITTETATLNWNYGSQNTATQYQVLLGTNPESLDTVQNWTERESEGTGYETSDSFTTTALIPNTKYYWQVNIKNDETVAQGEVVSFISKLENPVVTENVIYLYPGSNVGTSADLSWDADADKYEIYLNEELVADNVTENEYVLSGFKYNDNNSNNVKIVAVYNIDGESYESEGTMIDVYVSAYVAVNGTVRNVNNESAVANATVTYTGSSVMADVDEQTVEFVTDANGTFSGNLPAGTYVMKISADSYEDFNSEEKSYNYGENVTDNVDIYPVIPGDVTDFSYDSQYYPMLTWTFAENTTHYRVMIGESEDSDALQYFDNNTDWIATDGATEGSLQTTDRYIDPNTTYYVVIDVKNDNNAGERAIHPTYSYYYKPIANTFTTKPVFPVVYQAPENDSVLTDNAVTLKWKYVSGDMATHYQVMLGTDPDNLEPQGWKRRTEVATGYKNVEEFEISELEFNTQYYWQVNSALERDGAYAEEAKGEVWSFSFALLPPEDLAVTSEQLYPDDNVELTWNVVEGATHYNIYVDEAKVGETEDNSYTLESLGHGEHNIAITAVSSLGESSQTEPIEVYVTAYAQVEVNVKNQIGTAISGATVTFNGTDEFGVEQSYTDTTNADGNYIASVLLGEYTVTVNKERHSKHTTNVTVTEEKHTNIVLNTYNIFDVDIRASEIDHISIYLYGNEWEDEDYSGGYNVYYQRVKDADNNAVEEEEVFAGPSSFVKPVGIISILIADAAEFHNTWFGLPNGYYRIGVSYPGSGIINWSDVLELRDYHIFENAGAWNDSNNWRSGDMPSETSMAYLYAATEVNEDIEVQDIIVSRYGSLTINGSLTVNGKIVNEGNLNNVILNDGGQMRQNNTELTGKFVMNIENPDEWTEDNITGWQFISTPYKNHNISYFTEDLEGDYDLYKFDGSNTEEWLNHKDKNIDFEDVFVQGRGYLASYEMDDQFVTEGTSGNHVFNTLQTHTFDITNGSDASLENFHLLGNPFTFNMKWEHVHATDIVEGFSVVTKEGGYKYYPSGEIPVGDGFFVKTTSENATFVYDESRRNNREQSNSLNIKISGKEGDDNVVISFAGSGKEGFPKLENFNKGIANISVLKDDVRYGIHNCDEDLQVIELVFEASQIGLYTIEIEPNGNFDDIILVDRFTGEETDMLNGNYKFTASNQDDYNRFFIKLSREQVSTDNVNFVYQSGKELILNIKGTVQIIDVMGRIVYNEEVVNDVNRIDISTLRNSTYIVRVINEEGAKVKKVVVY